MNINETIGILKKKKIIFTPQIHNFRTILHKHQLHTVCQEARCPNISECYSEETATFLVMGDVCTRHCEFCSIQSNKPTSLDYNEINRIVEAINTIKLHYVVITSVTRDDLVDGGAEFLAKLAYEIDDRCQIPAEILFPDFNGNRNSLLKLLNAPIAVYNHNIEMVQRLFVSLRPQGNYEQSLDILKTLSKNEKITKTGFMVGLGESTEEILELIQDIKKTNVKILTIGQYIQPTKNNTPVVKYYSKAEFESFRDYARSIGIPYVVSNSFVRSSYKAKDLYERLKHQISFEGDVQ